MNFAPPQWVKDAATEALSTVSANHYSHPKGRIRLREALQKHYSPQFNRELNLDTEILVTSGANEGKIVYYPLSCTSHFVITGQYAMFTAFLDPGDEVIMIEPWFDQYLPSVTFNSGTPVYVALHPPPPDKENPTAADWTLNLDELRAAMSPKTKMIIVNTPHNPVGKVFTRQELEGIAAIAKEYNVLVMSDEVVSYSPRISP
jgi:kynurenine aminotransferase